MKNVIGTTMALMFVLAGSTAMAAGGGCGGHGGGEGSDRLLSSKSQVETVRSPIFVYKDGGFVLNPNR